MKKKFLNLFFASVVFTMMAPLAYGADIDVTVSGTVYENDGVTPLTGVEVTIAVNGVDDGDAKNVAVDGNGDFSIPSVTIDDAADDVVMVYIEDFDDDGNTITIENDLDIVGFDILEDEVIIKHENNGTLTGGDLTNSEVDGDDDMLFSAPAGDFIIETDIGFIIDSSVTFDADLTEVHLYDILIEGTLDMTNFNNLQDFGVNGDWTNNGGTFEAADDFVDFEGTADQVITESDRFNALIVQKSGGTLSLGANLALDNNFVAFEASVIDLNDFDLTIDNGTLNLDEGTFNAGSGTLSVEDFDVLDAVTFNPETGTVDFLGDNPDFEGTTLDPIDLHNATFTTGRDLEGLTLNISGDMIVTADEIVENGTIEFDGDGSRILDTNGDDDNVDVDIIVNKDASEIIGLVGDLTLDAVGQTLVVEEGIFDLFVSNFTGDMTVEDGGVLRLEGGAVQTVDDPTLESGSTVDYFAADLDDDITIQSDWEYKNISFSSADNFTIPDGVSIDENLTNTASDVIVDAVNLTIGGNFTLSADTTFTAPSGNLTITGDISTSAQVATFVHNDGTVILDGTAQTLQGDIDFNNLTKIVGANDGSDETLTFEEGGPVFTIEGALIFQGLDSDDNLLLVSADPGTSWEIDAQGATTLEHLNVTDSNATTAVTCTTSCTDGGGNTNWTFTVAENNNNSGGGGGSRGGGGLLTPPGNDNLDDTEKGTGSEGSSQGNDDSDDEEVDGLLFTFKDLDAEYWGLEYVRELYEKGIMTGTSEDTMEPKKVLNRAQFLKLVLEAFEYDVPESITLEDVQELGFSDLTEEDVDKWYAPYIYIGVQAGLITGYEDGTVRAQDSITRVEALVILSRVLEWDLEGIETSDEFPDVDSEAWFAPVVLKALMEGIVSGYEDGTFGPSNTLLRGEGAKIIAELI